MTTHISDLDLTEWEEPKEPATNWSVWTMNELVKPRHWTFEYEGSRESCLRYLGIATNDASFRLWDFKIVRPRMMAFCYFCGKHSAFGNHQHCADDT